MNFDSGQTDSFKCIENCDACMSISGGVNNDTVESTECLLNFIYYCALMVRLKAFNLKVQFLCRVLNKSDKIGLCFFTVNIRLANAEHIDIGSVYNKNFFHEYKYPFQIESF